MFVEMTPNSEVEDASTTKKNFMVKYLAVSVVPQQIWQCLV